jgi:hypothetical protein
MNLKLLTPTLRLACSVALANQQTGTLGQRAALAVGFDQNDNPQILFVDDVDGAKCPANITYATVVLGSCLGSITDTVAGLELHHDQAVERMANVILPNIARLIYETKLTDNRLLMLASVLDSFAINGIVAGIASTPHHPAKKPMLLSCEQPERN